MNCQYGYIKIPEKKPKKKKKKKQNKTKQKGERERKNSLQAKCTQNKILGIFIYSFICFPFAIGVHNFLLRTWGYSGCTLHTYFSNSVGNPGKLNIKLSSLLF